MSGVMPFEQDIGDEMVHLLFIQAQCQEVKQVPSSPVAAEQTIHQSFAPDPAVVKVADGVNQAVDATQIVMLPLAGRMNVSGICHSQYSGISDGREPAETGKYSG